MFVLQSLPPLCMWYRWIDTEQPEWAVRDVKERHRRAWESFFAEERREEAEAKEKAERERHMLERREEQRQRMEARKLQNSGARWPVRQTGRERENGLVRRRQQKRLGVPKENGHAGRRTTRFMSYYLNLSSSVLILY